jgi:hypothetical protein
MTPELALDPLTAMSRVDTLALESAAREIPAK